MTNGRHFLNAPTALTAILFLVRCGNESGKVGNGAPAGDSHGDGDHSHGAHSHAEEGPHHGQLIELGQEEYHAELTHDHASKTVTVYLLDSAATGPIAIGESEIALNLVAGETPRQTKLVAAPQDSDPAGKASRFSVADAELLAALEGEKTSGRLNVAIDGKTYAGEFQPHLHGEHEHK